MATNQVPSDEQNISQTMRLDPAYKRFFGMIPESARELDPYEFRMYGEYIFGCTWQGGEFQMGLRDLAVACGMSYGKAREVQASLEAKGYITLTPVKLINMPPIVTLRFDVWLRNAQLHMDSESSKIWLLELIDSVSDDKEFLKRIADCIGISSDTDSTRSESNPERQRVESDSDSYIESLNIPSVPAARTDAPAGQEQKQRKNPYAGYPSDVVNGLVNRKSSKPASNVKRKGKEQDEMLLAHACVQYFMEISGRTNLTEEMRGLFLDDIIVPTEDGSRTIYGGILHLWDTQPGFSEFFKIRGQQVLAIGKNKKHPEYILKNVIKLSENRPGKWPGFWLWAKQNPALCAGKKAADLAAEPRKVKLGPTLPPEYYADKV